MSTYTVLVPTYNRSSFVERQLRYFMQIGLRAPLVIADGSTENALKANVGIIEKYRSMGLVITHFIPPSDAGIVSSGNCRFGFVPRLNLALKNITTPFVHLLCDDCFVSQEFLESAAKLLGSDQSISTVIGQLWVFTLDPERQSTRLYGEIKEMSLAGIGPLKAGRTAVERFAANYGSKTINTSWAMHRHEDLAAVLGAGHAAVDAVNQIARESALPGPAEEWALDYLYGKMTNLYSLSSGTVHYIPHLMLGHQIHANNWGLYLHDGPDLNDALLGEYWPSICKPYIEAVVQRIVSDGKTSIVDARKAVESFFWKDIVRHLAHTADIRMNSFVEGDSANNDGGARRLLKKIPGLRRAISAARRLPETKRNYLKQRVDRVVLNAPEIKRIRDFIEKDELAD